ncbi:unnamed protein product [Strongylus vulgaris]|uniref:Uncharacterized protein n=1 Tax=Strongylus vulgaris TaxID=40348 RepID=A0A3P7INQ5_STRVU|nr:unnamed protein product [Strongylus vulgaris]
MISCKYTPRRGGEKLSVDDEVDSSSSVAPCGRALRAGAWRNFFPEKREFAMRIGVVYQPGVTRHDSSTIVPEILKFATVQPFLPSIPYHHQQQQENSRLVAYLNSDMPEVVQNGKVPPAPPPPPPPEKPRRADGRRRAMKKVDELHPAVEPTTG